MCKLRLSLKYSPLLFALSAPTICFSGAAANGALRANELPPAEPIRASSWRQAIAQPLLLATHLNTRDVGLQAATLLNGRLHLRREGLITIGIRESIVSSLQLVPLQGEDWIDLTQIVDLQIQLNTELQTVQLTLPFEQLSWARSEIQTATTPQLAANSAPGFLLNYDIYALQLRDARSLNAMSEWRAFASNVLFNNTILSQFNDRSSTQTDDSERHKLRNTRLDSSLSLSYPQSMVSVRVGDTLTSAQPWSRATRMGGLQIARNFALQPYRTTTPIPALMGTSAMPSDIELYINGVKQYQGRVDAGPFSLNAPVGITGMGTAQVVMTDALGRSTSLQYSLYNSPSLLAEGLSDWSTEIGWVRKNYGYRSFDYGSNPVISGSWSYGLTNKLTLQAHAEATPNLVNAGGGATWGIGSLGIASGALAVSQNAGSIGNLVQLGHSWNNSSLFSSLQITRANSAYRDAASLYDTQRPQVSGRALLGYSHRLLGNFSGGLVYLRNFDERAQRYASAGWSRELNGRGTLNLNLNHNLDDRRRSSVQLSMSWFLDDRINTGISLSRQDGNSSYSTYVNQSRPSEGGWGWGASAQSSNGSQVGGQAKAEYLGSSYEANGAIASTQGQTSAALGFSGALIGMDGHWFAARRVYDSFAVVSTNGVPNVPVKRDNNLIGMTDSEGVLLVTQLGAYRNNKIAIDTRTLPAQLRLPTPEQNVVPTDRAGTLVKFDLQKIRSASIVLTEATGTPIAVGSRVSLAEDSNQTIVGYDGTAYFEHLALHNRIKVTRANGSTCFALADWPSGVSEHEIPVIGPLICRDK